MDLYETAKHVASEIAYGRDGSYSLNYDYPDTGFMVGGKRWTLVGHPYQVDHYAIYDYLQAHKTILSWPNVFVGWWSKDGKVYLDISDHLLSREEAINLGRMRKELAIWDIENETEITLPKRSDWSQPR